MHTTLIAFLLVLVISACATPEVGYVTPSGGEPVGRQIAENAIVARKLNAQFKPPLDTPLEVLAAPLPDYPADFRRARIEGVVRLRFSINYDGTVSDIEVLGSPPPPLAAISVNSMLRWRFTEPKRNGQPIKLRAEYDIAFELK